MNKQPTPVHPQLVFRDADSDADILSVPNINAFTFKAREQLAIGQHVYRVLGTYKEFKTKRYIHQREIVVVQRCPKVTLEALKQRCKKRHYEKPTIEEENV